ncbi:MAG: hypothetical protein U9N85_02890 [Bacteroidota bacterium]|nr:hypothetical protein [Bacteroidota bacterium]
MQFRNHRSALFSAIFLIGYLVLSSCGCEDSDESGVIIQKDTIKEESRTGIIKFNGRLFNLPSPVQISELLKTSNSSFNQDFLNPSQSYQNYSSSFKQALNLGVYGADLAYINIFEKHSQATSYFEVVKKLSVELNIVNSFSDDVLRNIEKNKKNKDSLLVITSKAYRNADRYLINNERNDIGVLILAGGWIESLSIISKAAEINATPKMINRIGQQKYALNNLIELMRPYYQTKSEAYDKLLTDLADLALIFDGVVLTYEYKEPETLPKEQMTLVKSKAVLTINDYQLEHIRKKIIEIRNEVIQ